MSDAQFHVGALVRARARFRNMAGALTDPTGIVAKYQNPAGTETTKTYGTDAEVVRAGVGDYYIDVNVNAAGTWYVRFNGTGAVQDAVEDSFTALATQF